MLGRGRRGGLRAVRGRRGRTMLRVRPHLAHERFAHVLGERVHERGALLRRERLVELHERGAILVAHLLHRRGDRVDLRLQARLVDRSGLHLIGDREEERLARLSARFPRGSVSRPGGAEELGHTRALGRREGNVAERLSDGRERSGLGRCDGLAGGAGGRRGRGGRGAAAGGRKDEGEGEESEAGAGAEVHRREDASVRIATPLK